MSKKLSFWISGLLLMIFGALAGSWLLLAHGEKPNEEKALSAVGISSTVSPTLAPPPPPVGTYQPPTLSPQPTEILTTRISLPPPPATVALTPGTPAPTAVASLTSIASAVATVTARTKQNGSSSSGSNVAWGAETSNSLVIWVGTYADAPSPSISNAKAVAKWAVDPPLQLRDLSFSPDGQSLAVLTIQPFVGEEGDYPTWLYVIDLNTGAVQHLPDYASYSLYEYAFSRTRDRILGWVDNDTLAVQQGNEYAAVLASKSGTSYTRSTFPHSPASALQTALSPDKQTFFSQAGGYWLYNVDGSNPRQIVSQDDAKLLFNPQWSPDGKYINFVSPVADANGTDLSNMGLWALNLSDYSQTQVSSGNVWGTVTPWSPDSSAVAFLGADLPVSDPTAKFDQPDKVNTNIFIATISNQKVRQLTRFQGTKSSTLSWTLGGNLLLSSTAGSRNGAAGIVSILGSDGTSSILVASSSGEALVHPVVFNTGVPTGMPRVGNPSLGAQP